jgi:predicted RNA-binding protein with PUA-like domain
MAHMPKSLSASRPGSATGRYWLVKSEPDCFSIDDLKSAPKQTTYWDGVRNYQARNTLRDEMRIGDLVLYYHSNAKPPAVVGLAQVVREGYPDFTAFDPHSDHFDPKSKLDSPTWFMVDLKFVEKFARDIGLDELRQHSSLSAMVLLQRGSRLSVQPVRPNEFKTILGIAKSMSI